MHHRFRLLCLIVFFGITTTPALSQDIRFTKVSLPEENISGIITSILQDQKGYIWFCTNGSGLFKYDGVNIKNYRPDPLNPNSLTNNYVECLYEDRNGNIWACTFAGGLDKLDPKTGVFTHYKHNEKDPSSLGGDSVSCILEDHEGMMWIGTMKSGLDRLDPKTGKFTHYRHQDNDPGSLSHDLVKVIYEDRKDVLWIGTGSPFFGDQKGVGGGLNRFDRTTGKFTSFLHDDKDPHSLIDNRVRAILDDSRGNFWVGTAGDGLHRMDRDKGTFERLTNDPAHPEKLSRPPVRKYFSFADDFITFIREDKQGALWIGTLEAGLMRYEPESGKITRYNGRKGFEGNFPDSTTWCAAMSRDGIMWMSNFIGEEIYRFDPTHQNVAQNHVMANHLVNAFAQESGIQYFGTDSGIVRVDLETGNTRIFSKDPQKPGTLADNNINVLFKDRQGRLWVGAGNGGLSLYDSARNTFTNYRHNPGISTSLAFDVILNVYEDRQSNLWIGTVNGLDMLNKEKAEFVHYKAYPGDTLPGGRNMVPAILEDSKNNFWVGNYAGGGLHIMDRKTGKFKDYLAGHSILRMLEDGSGNIWVGGEDGLYTYNVAVDSFSLFIDPTSGNSIITHAMVEDNNKNIWISSPTGIYRINTVTNEVARFGKEFGINGNTLVYLSAFKAADGKLIFGNGFGYYSFYPDKISGNTSPPEILLTDFRIADRLVTPGIGSELTEDLSKAKSIRLSHDQNVFTFSFNVIHYSNPDANRAMYMLENYDKGWRPTGSERTAYYYNIPPGHYTFRIKAMSSEGVWAEKTIDLVITPPWWRSWWAYLLYGLLIAAIAYAVNRVLKQRVINAERERTRIRELEQSREIEKAYHDLKATQAQLIQSEKMASLGELTAGIAHEIQNPLNFVNNFSEVNTELIDEMHQEIDKGNYDEVKTIANSIRQNEEKISYQGKRADAIVKGMLQHSQASAGQKEPADINKLADEYLRLAYHGLRAKDKSFNATLKTDFDETIGNVNIIPQDIGRVVLNIINNALYAVNEKRKLKIPGYESTVTVGTKKSDGKVVVSIKDNGSGIPKKVLDKIFQPFFTTKPTGEGTGLGLSLSYDIVKAHGGELKVETGEGEFTEFRILLPV